MIAGLAVVGLVIAPQWSPPLVGGMTVDLGDGPAVRVDAAMEPAAGGRDDFNRSVRESPYMPEPQWSPPLVGGMTRIFTEQDRVALKEPQWSPPLVGGMTRILGMPVTPGKKPQWSPPLVGGMTASRLVMPAAASSPQWSPPLVGGMTSLATPALTARGTCRNGARRWWAG